MVAPTEENYLKALFYLHQKHATVSLTDLSQQMSVSAPTANNMVKRLQKRGWVVYKKYKPLKLNAAGRKMAGAIIRKHRLTEMFLFQIMGFGWEEVHEIAEEIEHLKMEKFFDRMDQLLGFPLIDPHGSPIPHKDGSFVSLNYQKLSDMKKGQMVQLCALKNNSAEFMLFLNRKNIQLGTVLTIHQIEPFDKSFSVSYEGHPHEVLSETTCNCLLVKPAKQSSRKQTKTETKFM